MNKSDIVQAASHSYYMTTDMIRFLLSENLALKTLLCEKGIITPEEFRTFRERAAAILLNKEEEQILKMFKDLLNKPTEEVSQDNAAAVTRET